MQAIDFVRVDLHARLHALASRGDVRATLSLAGRTAQPAPQAGPAAPPPPPVAAVYHVAENGQTQGPYSLARLGRMAHEGTFTRDTLVWSPGFAGTATADVRINLEPYVTGVNAPLAMVQPPNDPRKFVVEQFGRIRVIRVD